MKNISKTNLFRFVVMSVILIALVISTVVIVSANNTPMYHVGVGNLSAPVAGRLPDCDVTPNGQYTVSVQWFRQEGGNFVHYGEDIPLHAGDVYQAAVHLRAKSGYYFDTESQHFGCTINGLTNSTFRVIDETHVIMYHTYPVLAVAPVETVDISVDAPRAGDTPDFTAEVIGNCILSEYNEIGYINGVFWMDAITDKVLTEEDTFIAGRSYDLLIVIKADNDHYFDSSSKNAVRINGKTAYITTGQPTPNSDYRVASVTLKATEAIKEINVENFITPVVGNTPDFWLGVDADDVEVRKVTWGKLTNVDGIEKVVDVDENHVFEDGATYMLCIGLESTGNRTFARTEGSSRYYDFTANINDKKATPAPWREYDEHNVLQTLDLFKYVELQVWYTLKQDVIDSIDILQLPTPVAGETPSAGNVWVAQDDIIIESIGWGYIVNENGYERVVELKDGETFQKGVSYMVWLRLRNKGDAIFDYDADRKVHMMSATINWKSASVSTVLEHTGYEYVAVDPYNYVEVYTWIRCNGEVVDNVDIGGITAPVAGQTPSYDINFLNTGYYSYGSGKTTELIGGQLVDVYYAREGVSWYDVTDDEYGTPVLENQPFIGGHRYELRVSLYANTNCKFAADNENNSLVTATVNGNEASIFIRNVAESEIRVEYIFECPIVIIDKIEFNIPDPVIGEAPCYDKIVTDAYHSEDLDGSWEAYISNNNGIFWFETNNSSLFLDPAYGDVFKENTDYTVSICIVANEGYEFAKELEIYINGYQVYKVMHFSTVALIQNDYPITECIHSIVPVDATAPTCTENGLIAHYECEKCHQMFSDANGENILDDGEDWAIIPATGHIFTDYICEDGMAGTHKAVCSCGGYEIIECDYEVKIIATPNEYAERAVMLYTCRLCNSSYFSPFESMSEEKEFFENNSTGVNVSFGGESVSVPSDVTLEVEDVNEERISEDKKKSITDMAGGNAEIIVGYNISFQYDTIQYVPTQTVVVTIPLGDDYNGSDVYKVIYTDYTYNAIAVYQCENNDDDGSISFETDHFSIYIVLRVEDSNSGGDIPDNPDNGETPDDVTPETPESGEKDHSKCLEEASGWKRFWNGIGNFFRRIFSKNVKCVCGDKVDKKAYTEFKKIFKANK